MMERINLTDEVDNRTIFGGFGSDVSMLLIGCAVLLPKKTQDKITGWNDRNADGKCVVDVCLTIGGVEVPIREYAESLYRQVDRIAEEMAKELVSAKTEGISKCLGEIESKMRKLLTTELTAGSDDDY
jgi:hypothetical protein